MTLLLLLSLCCPRPAAAQEKAEVKAALERFASHDYEPSAAPPRELPEARLGRTLFFDPRLSANRAMSCSTCHQPASAWTDRLPRARGLAHKELRRRTPSLLNARLIKYSYGNFFWDGRAHSIEEAALTAIQNPEEMAQPMPELVKRLKAVPEYVRRFGALYPEEGIAPSTIGKSLGAFVESLAPEGGDFVRFVHGEDALSPAATRGFLIFSGKARCIRCHAATVLTDGRYHTGGVKPAGPQDLGRYEIEKLTQNRRAFRTPSLRNAALTPPYMHDGSLKTLREVVDFYDRGGDDPDGREPDMGPLALTEQEKKDLVAFLEALPGPRPAPVIPQVPPP